MRKAAAALVGLAYLLVVPGWTSSRENRLPAAVEAVLSKPARLEVLSLEPQAGERKLAGVFHGWNVLGRTSIRDPKLQAEIVAAVGRGIAESDGSAARCFDPRHDIRATSGEAVADLVICFRDAKVPLASGPKE